MSEPRALPRKDLFSELFKPQTDLASVLLRLGLAAIFVVHGFIKLMQDKPLSDDLSLTGWLALGWAELVCGLMLAIGLLSRPAGAVLFGLQTGAIILVTRGGALTGLAITKHGADFKQVGPEYNLVLMVMCLAVVLLGSGSLSVDSILWSRWRRRHKQTGTESVAAEPAQPVAAAAGQGLPVG